MQIKAPYQHEAATANAPTLGTSQRLFGTYTVMMVDPDIPPATAGGATSELLHWMQSNLVSSNTSTMIGGVQAFEMVIQGNTTPVASYIQPSPPDKAPNTHRYTQLLLNTTSVGGNTTALSILMTAGKTRTNFSAVNVVKAAGVSIVAGNSFNVTNGTNTGLVQSNITKTTSVAGAGAASATGAVGTGTGTGTQAGSAANASSVTTGAPKATGGVGELKGGNAAFIAGLGALAAAVAML